MKESLNKLNELLSESESKAARHIEKLKACERRYSEIKNILSQAQTMKAEEFQMLNENKKALRECRANISHYRRIIENIQKAKKE